MKGNMRNGADLLLENAAAIAAAIDPSAMAAPILKACPHSGSVRASGESPARQYMSMVVIMKAASPNRNRRTNDSTLMIVK